MPAVTAQMVTAAVKYTLCADMLLTPGVAECLYEGLRNAQATVLIVSTIAFLLSPGVSEFGYSL